MFLLGLGWECDRVDKLIAFGCVLFPGTELGETPTMRQGEVDAGGMGSCNESAKNDDAKR